MKVAVLFSGGKDSTLALYEAIKDGHEICCLVSVIPKNPESYMFHYPNIELTKLQARALGLKIVTKESGGKKESELSDLEGALRSVKREHKIEGVVVGAIASVYQHSRVEKICKRLGLRAVAPLWRKDPEELWESLLGYRFRVIITAVACEGLDESWLGREIDKRNIGRLISLSKKHRFHACGEGGEFETFVIDGPIFKKEISIRQAKSVWEYNSGFYVIEKAELKEK